MAPENVSERNNYTAAGGYKAVMPDTEEKYPIPGPYRIRKYLAGSL
jgi:hypothetical protein